MKSSLTFVAPSMPITAPPAPERSFAVWSASTLLRSASRRYSAPNTTCTPSLAHGAFQP
jgi:hypothetical protein